MTDAMFIEQLAKLGIELNEYQMEQFNKYYEMLIEWNEKMNLTAITKREEVFEKHFYDSILASQIIELDKQKICDVGAGAGFPSVPLKIIYPDLQITIVDSLNKRITFLNELKDVLDLKEFKAINSRAEDFVKTHRESFDIVMARAVANLNILSELCLPLVKEKGYFIALKGPKGQEELTNAKLAIEKLGGKTGKFEEYRLISENDVRSLILIEKVEKTNKKYPRNYGQIKKKPL